MGSRRNMGFLLLVLLATAVAVAINLFADDEAQRIAAGSASAPAAETSAGADDNGQADGAAPVAEPEYDPALVDTPQCQRAQAEFDGVWDASIENPEDPALEEALEIALSEVNAACGG